MGFFGNKQPAAQQPPGQPKTTKGPVTAVPCPHCGKPNDFEPHLALQTLERGQIFDCDECGRAIEIHAVQPITIVWAKQSNKQLRR